MKKEKLSPEEFEAERIRVSTKSQDERHVQLTLLHWQCFYISYQDNYTRAILYYFCEPTPTQLDPKPKKLHAMVYPDGRIQRYMPSRNK